MKTENDPQRQVENKAEGFLLENPKGALPLKQIVLCFGFVGMVGLSNGATGVLIPDLRNFYRVDNSMIGLLYIGETAGYALSAFCSGAIVAKLGLRRFMLTGVGLFALSCLVLGLAPIFGVLLFSRTALGFGMGIMESGANFYVAGLPRRTALLNYLHASFGAGSLAGPLVATFVLAGGWDWNSVYLIWFLLSTSLLLSFSFFFSGQMATAHSSSGKAEKGSKLMKATLSHPVVWLGTIFLLIYVGIETSAGAWSYTFLTEARLYDTLFSGWAVSGYWFGLTLGRIIMVPLTERFGVGSRGLIQIGLGLAGAGIAVVWLGGGEIISALGLALLGLGLGPIFPTTLAILSRVVSPRLVPTTIGFASSLSISGIAIFPPLAGFLIDQFGLGLFLPYLLLLGLGTTGAWLIFRLQGGSQLD